MKEEKEITKKFLDSFNELKDILEKEILIFLSNNNKDYVDFLHSRVYLYEDKFIISEKQSTWMKPKEELNLELIEKRLGLFSSDLKNSVSLKKMNKLIGDYIFNIIELRRPSIKNYSDLFNNLVGDIEYSYIMPLIYKDMFWKELKDIGSYFLIKENDNETILSLYVEEKNIIPSININIEDYYKKYKGDNIKYFSIVNPKVYFLVNKILNG